jgi:hypothetical protein
MIAAQLPLCLVCGCCSSAAYGRLPLQKAQLPLQGAEFAAAECCRLPLQSVCMYFGAPRLPLHRKLFMA